MQINKRDNLVIQELIENIKKYYSFEDSTSLSHEDAHENFKKAVIKKPVNVECWRLFTEELKESFPSCHLRDFGYEHFEPSFRINISINNDHGLVCCLSLMGPYIGYYYCVYDSNTITPFNIHPIFNTEQDRNMSFIPFNFEQASLQLKINSILVKYFKNYAVFTPEVSAFEVDKVIIEGLPYYSVQLFHLYFSHYLNGLI